MSDYLTGMNTPDNLPRFDNPLRGAGREPLISILMRLQKNWIVRMTSAM
ncbi:hypothetical protein [Cronobacter condimenti]|nr:hypothetical protein [Cronobacter condimenti]